MQVNEHTPVVKEVKPGNFLFHRKETRMEEVASFKTVGQELYREAVRLGLMISGPVQWHYLGFTGPTAPFTLEIALPVVQVTNSYDGEFHFKRTAAFKSVVMVHEGEWSELKGCYEKLVDFIKEHKLERGTVVREVYIHTDFNTPDANVTEIQIGIA